MFQAEPGKSPLALLAKTCETIGLPEGSSKKNGASSSSSPQGKKDEKNHILHHQHHQQQQQSKQKSSPRSTPQSKEPTLTFPGLPKPSFPMGMPGMMQGFPFFNPMMTAYGCFPGAFPMSQGFMGAQRLPCPFAMMRQPCANPACVQCPSSSSNAAKNGQMTAEMMSQFAAHPLFSMYAGMMPGVPTSSYQALLAASAAASTSAGPTDYSNVASTSKASPQPKPTAQKSQKSAKFPCNWVDSDVPCGKVFDEENELASHVKKMHAPSPSSSASSEQSTSTGKASRSSTTTPHRFNPYGKPVAPAPPTMQQMGMNMAMNPLVLPFSLQAMYSNRLMSTVAHQ